jgi:hypothetical protein
VKVGDVSIIILFEYYFIGGKIGAAVVRHLFSSIYCSSISIFVRVNFIMHPID